MNFILKILLGDHYYYYFSSDMTRNVKGMSDEILEKLAKPNQFYGVQCYMYSKQLMMWHSKYFTQNQMKNGRFFLHLISCESVNFLVKK